MKKLSKPDVAELNEIVEELNSAAEAVSTAIEQANEKVGEANDAINEYNACLEKATEYRDRIVGQMEDFFSEKSEKWQEGDAGSAYDEWKSEWDNIDFAEVDQIEEVKAPDMDHSGELEALPQEASS